MERGSRAGQIGQGAETRRVNQRPAAVLLTIALLVFAVAASSALASTSEADSTPSDFTPEALEEGLALSRSESLFSAGAATDSSAAARLPKNDVDRAGALQLFQAVFTPGLESAAGAFGDLDSAEVLSKDAAVVGAENEDAVPVIEKHRPPGAFDSPPEGSEAANASDPVLVESTLPLEAENTAGDTASVDLGLERQDGELAPANPLVEIGIPNELGDGISLPEQGVTIQLDGAPSGIHPSEVSSIEEAAFFPSVAEDSDLAVVATPVGMETLTQLRTPDAPKTQHYSLDLPAGAELSAAPGGGARISRGTERLLYVPPPSAYDADGTSVPVSLSIEGAELKVEAEPSAGASFPILVDPVFQTYTWGSTKSGLTGNLGVADWYSATNVPTYQPFNNFQGGCGAQTPGCPGQLWGLMIDSGWGQPGYDPRVVPGSQANWNYYVPRFFSDYEDLTIHDRPWSWIESVVLQPFEYILLPPNGQPSSPPSRQASPYFMGGIWDSKNGGWIAGATRNGIEGSAYKVSEPFVNKDHNENAKNFGVALASSENGANPDRYLYVGGAQVELTDKDTPLAGFSVSELKGSWVGDQPTTKIPYTSTDLGLGISKITVEQPSIMGKPSILETKQGCTGIVASPCPRKWNSTTPGAPALAYDPSVMPQGENWVKLRAYDPIGHVSDEGGQAASEFDIRVDRSRPRLALSGSIMEQAGIGTSRPQYGIRYSATDGGEIPLLSAEEPPAISLVFGEHGEGDGQFDHPGDVAVDKAGNLWVVDHWNSRIEKYTSSGAFSMKFGSWGTAAGKLNHPSALALDSSGNIWVADTGNSRVEEFNAKGEYLTSFGSQGSGNGQFLEPEGIAIDPKGNIWVSDTYHDRIEKFTGKGEFVKAIGSHGTGAGQLREPTTIDFGPGGNLWVADWLNNRVVGFDESGAFLRQFGTAGTGQGQFAHPNGLVVDSKGEIWVGDQGGNRVEGFNQQGEFLTSFGSTGTGPRQFKFECPIGIASDNRGNLWITDPLNDRIQKWQIPNYGPQYSSSYGSGGSGSGQLLGPGGIAVDAQGNMWIADSRNNRVEELSESGAYVGQFGSTGTAAGQFKDPVALTIDPKGNLWVIDYENSRVEEFSKTGGFIRQVGSVGTGSGKFTNPMSIASDAKGNILVSDAYKRVQKFNEKGEYVSTVYPGTGGFTGFVRIAVAPNGHLMLSDLLGNKIVELTESGSLVREFGAAGTGEGQFAAPAAITVDPKGFTWIVDQSNNRVEEFNPSGEFVTQFGSAGTGAGQFSLNFPTGITADSKGNLWISDGNNNRIQKWTTPKVNQSGVASAKIEIDGKAFGSPATPGCATQNCALSKEVILHSSELTPGAHTLKVTATDAVGLSTSKEQTFSIAKDTTAPSIVLTGTLKQAPEGWVEQKPYTLNAEATDSGFGVKQIQLKVDGNLVEQTSATTCEAGGCSKFRAFAVNAASYDGGAHQVEVVAVDGAGNTSASPMTMNVDPKGVVDSEEAEATLEAVEDTSPVNVIGEPGQGLELEGTNPDLGFEAVGGELHSNGAVKTTVSEDPGSRTTVTSVNPGLLEEGGAVGEPEIQVKLEPSAVSGSAGDTEIVESGSATISVNSHSQADAVTRPLEDGALTFQEIRDATAPESYAWSVSLIEGEELKQIDPQHAAVLYEGHTLMSIFAEPARDAVGTSVPTSLSVSGAVVTLTVAHRGSDAGGHPFVYPVIGGSGWEGGFRTYPVFVEPPHQEAEQYWESRRLIVGPPEAVASSNGTATASSTAGSGGEAKKQFMEAICGHSSFYGRPGDGYTEDCGNPFKGEAGYSTPWQAAMRGAFWYKPGSWAEERGAKDCAGRAYDTSLISYYYVPPYTECHYGPRTSDGNGGAKVSVGHYLRAQAHWNIEHKGKCTNDFTKEAFLCPPPNPAITNDVAIEIHLWPSGAVKLTVPE